MTQLPNETLTAVFTELPPPTLAVVARVSLRFNAVAERILYSSIFVTDIISEASPFPLRTLWWCEAMRRRPHLIETARKLQIRWQADPSAPPLQYQYLANACERLGEVIRVLAYLETLDLFLGPANLIPPTFHPQHPHARHPSGHSYRPSPSPPGSRSRSPPLAQHAVERVIRGAHLSQLRSCALGAEWAKGVSPYTHTLVAFLAPLGSLRHLRLSDLHSEHNNDALVLDALPPAALPLLSSFRGSPDAAAAILPGRPVQYLSLTGQDSDVNRDNLPRMTRTSVPLRCLDLSAMSVRPMLLRNVSTYLPTVESLRVKLALRHTLHYSFSGIRILAGLSSVLHAFDQLAFLDLSPTGVDGVGRADSLEELGLCREWSRACPSLRRVIFPSQTEWVLDPNSAGVWNLIQN